MSEDQKLGEVLKLGPVVTVGGVEVRVRKLLVKDWQETLGLYGGMLGFLGRQLGHGPSAEEIAEGMPLILADGLAAGDEAVVGFLRTFCPDLTEEQLAGIDFGEIEALWGAIHGSHRVPFGRVSAAMTDEVVAALTAMQSEIASSEPASSPPDSTPETPD